MEIEQMKKGKSIRAFLIAVIALALVAVAAICVFGADGTVIRGDVNGDGKVNSYDADYLLMHASFPNNPKYAINQSGDMNGDGKVNSYDADRLLMHASFPNNPKYALADSFSEGLEYELNDDGKGYPVSGIGDCKDTNLIIPSTYNNLPVTSIGVRAFSGCTSLEKIALPVGVTSISKAAFSGCTSLTDITIPDSVTSIGEFAFSSCTSFTSVTMPDSVTSIGEGAFSECTSLASITVESGNAVYHSAGNCLIETESKTLVAGCKSSVIPTDGSVTSIGNDAFSGCRNLTSIKIPDNITSIGERAFQMCTSLEKIIFEGTEEQWNAVQKGTNWDSNAGSGPSSGKYTLVFAPEAKPSEGLGFYLNSDKKSYSVYIGSCKDNDIVIPSTYDGLPVTSIGRTGFSHRKNITSVWIPDSITVINNGAFMNCVNLACVTFGNHSKLTSIGGDAFHDCESLESIAIPDSVTSIGIYAFAYTDLREVRFGENSKLDSIGGYAFSFCTGLTGITIPESVTLIGSNAFFGCEDITSIAIPKNVKTIGDDAFLGCWLYVVKNESSLDLSIGSRNNGYAAFYSKMIINADDTITYRNDENTYILTEDGFLFSKSAGEYTLIAYTGDLETVTLPLHINGATYEVDSFHGARNVIIPKGMTSIGKYSFCCAALNSITIPDSVTNIEETAFGGCRLEHIIVEIGNPNYYVSGNCLIETASKTLVAGFNDSIIPADGSVTSIGDSAFEQRVGLVSISIPDSVTSIGDRAFYNCGKIADVTIPGSVEIIGNDAFYGTAYYNNKNNWVDGALYNGNCLLAVTSDAIVADYKIKEGTRCIAGGVFLFYKNLISITVPSSVKSIGNSAFSNCTGLTDVIISSGVHTIGDNAFCDCTNLETITFKGTEEQWNAITKESGWDYDAGSGTSSGKYTLVFAPEANTSEGLSFVSNGDGTCYVSGIGSCTDTDIVIPAVSPDGDKVTRIGNGAFSSCSSLTSITIPSSVTSIGDSAFYWCFNLASITVESGNTVYHSAGNCIIETAAKTLIAGCKNSVIPDDGSVTSIGDYAFCWCTGLTSITIPDSVTSIGKWAFDECFNLLGITIPNSVTSIGDSAFRYCENITSIVIPDSVTSIGQSAFSGCWHLESITVESGNTVYHSAGNCIIETASKTLVAVCQNSVIPDDGSVTSIGDSAFYGCARLASITIPDSVTSIGDEAFYNTGLASITIPDSVTSIGQSAFSGCRHLESITVESGNAVYHSAGNCIIETATKTLIAGCKNSVIPDDGSVTSIGRSAFEDCDGLTNITIPDGVTSIGYSAFRWCSSLTGITIPDSVTNIGSYAFDDTAYYKNGANWTDGVLYIGNYLIKAKSGELPADYTIKAGTKVIADYAFSWCRNLTSITLPDSVTSIGVRAFSGCTSLTDITIPDSVTSIGEGAFSGCRNLTSITIPCSVTSIGEEAFSWCTNLETITFKGTEEQWNSITKGSSWDYNAGKSTSSGKYNLIFEK